MNLYEWYLSTQQSIAHGNTGVGKGSGIDDDSSHLIMKTLVNKIHLFMFGVGLFEPQ